MIKGRRWFLLDQGHGLDLHQHAGVDESGNLDHGSRGPNVPEDFPVCAPDGFPLRNIRYVYACPDHVLHRGAGTLEGKADVGQRLNGLGVGVANTHQFTIRSGGRAPGNQNHAADTDGP